MENLRPNENRANTAIIIFWIILVTKIATLLSSFYQYRLLQTVASGGEVSHISATVNDIFARMIAVISFLASIVAIITFIQWFRRAYYNLHLKVKHLSFSEGWAAGCWFVPIINLFRPFQIMKELFVETDLFLFKRNTEIRAKLATPIIGWWWALWILSSMFESFYAQISLYLNSSLDQMIFRTVLNIISSIITIVLSLITIKMIKNYSSVEALLNEPEEIILPIEENKIDVLEVQ